MEKSFFKKLVSIFFWKSDSAEKGALSSLNAFHAEHTYESEEVAFN